MMISLSPVDLLLRVSAASVGAGEYPANTNRGPYVEPILKSTGTEKGNPWCASQISRWGKLALGKDWPVVNTASVVQMCEWAEARKVLYSTKTPPQVGDLYTLWNAKRKRQAHVGLIVSVQAGLVVLTRDGNTALPGDDNPETQREGWVVAEKFRTLTDKDCIIRWVEALA